MNNYDIARGFIKKDEIENVINEMYNKYDFDKECIEPRAIPQLNKRYKEKIYLKFKMIFQRQIILDKKEAVEFYNANIQSLNQQIDILYFIIEQINELFNISYIPDKLTLCSFFRFNIDTFDFLLNDATVDPQVQEIFKNLNEFILSITQIGLESGALNNYAWNRLQLKNKYGGHGIEATKENESSTTIVVSSDIQRKLSTDYDFTKLLSNDADANK